MKFLLRTESRFPKPESFDGESFYDFADMHGDIILTPDVANAFWDAGFKEINEPDENGLMPLFQSWFCANFKMVAWFVEKGISPSSTRCDASLIALHLYAKRIDYLGAYFFYNIEILPRIKNT